MFIDKLEVVNACLATMGEAPLNTLEDDHSYKAAALTYLDQVNQIEQKRGWWFNSEYIQLLPDAESKYIYVPVDALAIKSIDRYCHQVYAQRGRRLYNVANNNYEWDRAVWIDLVRLLPFEELPFHAADAVGYGTVMRFQREYDGDASRYGQLSQDYSRSRMELSAEDTRNRKPNLLRTVSNQLSMGAIGGYGGTYLPTGPWFPFERK